MARKAATPPPEDEETEVEEAPTPKRRRGSKEGASVGLDLNALFSDSLDTISKRQGFESSGLEMAPPMSTGVLSFDLLYNGGIRPAMYTHAGAEQSAKTTGAITIMASAVKHKVPIIGFADYEGSTGNSRNYVQAILKSQGLNIPIDQVFGKKDESTGKWTVKPIVRYRAETILEKFYDWLSEILRELPDKRHIAGKWWLVFDETKVNKARLAEFADVSMNRKFGKGIWIPAQDSTLQAVILVDSYPAMNPECRDTEDQDNGLAMSARAFSKNLPRVKGRLASKMVALVGINQLRAVPMAMYGPKETEPCGNALKLNSDARMRFTSRALSAAPFTPKAGKKTYDEQEPSVLHDGVDTYRYVHIKAIKMKMGIPQRQSFIRLWVDDPMGVAHGIDPVFDVVYYLKETGQLSGKRKGFLLNLEGLGKGKKPIPWSALKKWILGTKEDMTKMSNIMGYKPMSIRAFCFKQMKDGTGERLYVEAKNAAAKGGGEDDGGDAEE